MSDIRTTIENNQQGALTDTKIFVLGAVVKPGMSSQFRSVTNIENADNKLFLVCSCNPYTNKDTNEDEILLYLSNDPNDFIYTNTNLINNHGVMPFSKVDDNFIINLTNRKHATTNSSSDIRLPKNNPFDLSQKTEFNSLEFSLEDGTINTDKTYHGIPYQIKFSEDNSRLNFKVRKSVTTGRIGPSIATFSEPSTVFEYLKTSFVGMSGTSFYFEEDIRDLGLSRLVLESNSQPFSEINKFGNDGIIYYSQGTSNAYNIFSVVEEGMSEIKLRYNNTQKYLGASVFNPNTAYGNLNLQINIRSDTNNFVTMTDISNTNNEIFDYYFLNIGDFTTGGIVNNSRQYINDSTGDIEGGICYTFYNNLHKNEGNLLKSTGLVHLLNTVNGTPINSAQVTGTVTEHHAPIPAVYSSFSDAVQGINLNKFNTTSPDTGSEKTRNITSSKAYPSLKNNIDPSEPIPNLFTTTPTKKQNNDFIIIVVTMSVLLLLFIIFSIYYYNIEIC